MPIKIARRWMLAYAGMCAWLRKQIAVWCYRVIDAAPVQRFLINQLLLVPVVDLEAYMK